MVALNAPGPPPNGHTALRSNKCCGMGALNVLRPPPDPWMARSCFCSEREGERGGAAELPGPVQQGDSEREPPSSSAWARGLQRERERGGPKESSGMPACMAGRRASRVQRWEREGWPPSSTAMIFEDVAGRRWMTSYLVEDVLSLGVIDGELHVGRRGDRARGRRAAELRVDRPPRPRERDRGREPEGEVAALLSSTGFRETKRERGKAAIVLAVLHGCNRERWPSSSKGACRHGGRGARTDKDEAGEVLTAVSDAPHTPVACATSLQATGV